MGIFSVIRKAVHDYNGQKRMNANYKELVSDKINYQMLRDMVNGVADKNVGIHITLRDSTKIDILPNIEQQVSRFSTRLAQESQEFDIDAAIREMESGMFPGR